MRTIRHLAVVFFLLVALLGLRCAKEGAPPPAAPTAETTATTATTASSQEPAAPAPATASAQPATRGALASADGEKPGIRLDVTELKRSSGGTVNLKFVIVNDSDGRLDFGYNFAEKGRGFADIGGVYLIDPEGKKKYFVARDTEDNCVCSRNLKDLAKGSSLNLWAKFPAPPPEVKKISVVVPHFSPLDDVPIGE